MDVLARLYESENPDDAFRALVRALEAAIPLRGASWSSEEPGWGGIWPPVATPAAEGGDDARGKDFPLPHPIGQLRLILDPPIPGSLPAEADRVIEAFAHTIARLHREAKGREERAELRRRVEESEALHVLGLAANRSLNPDEVVALVARCARSLLGGHYVTVAAGTGTGQRILTWLGLASPAAEEEDPIARRVVETGKPLIIDLDSENADAAILASFHGAEGMRSALGVPLSLFGEPFGALTVGYRRAYAPQGRDVRLALTIAGHAAVALSNARLHTALEERSAELERTYEELRWSAETKERFFASMSHELRTPLNAILGYHSLLLDGIPGELPSPLRPFLERADRSARNLLLLVDDVLDLSRLEAGKLELTREPTDLSEVVDDARLSLQPAADAKGLLLDARIPASLPHVFTDRDRVRQVLLNLLSNAVKFTDQGSVTVTLEALGPDGELIDSAEPSTMEYIEIRVADTGPGVDPEDRERIFHEFEQVKGAGSGGGTGLGLPISRKLARLLGGELSLEAFEGRGCTFTLRLPVDLTPTGEEIANLQEIG